MRFLFWAVIGLAAIGLWDYFANDGAGARRLNQAVTTTVDDTLLQAGLDLRSF